MTKWCAPSSRSRNGAPSAFWPRGRLEVSAAAGAILRESAARAAGSLLRKSSSLYVVDFAVDEDDLHVLIVVSLLLTQIGDPNRLSHVSDHFCNALAELDGERTGGSWRDCNLAGLSEHILLLPVGLLCLLSQLVSGVWILLE